MKYSLHQNGDEKKNRLIDKAVDFLLEDAKERFKHPGEEFEETLISKELRPALIKVAGQLNDLHAENSRFKKEGDDLSISDEEGDVSYFLGRAHGFS